MKFSNRISPLAALGLAVAMSVSLASQLNAQEVEKRPPAERHQEIATPHSSFEHIVELLPKDFRPAFTKETVVKLNAIVKRAYAVINEFDATTRSLQSSLTQTNSGPEQVSAITKKHTALVDALNQRAKAALSDMDKAVETLKASNEYYNPAVLSGMRTFVQKVHDEVSAESTAFTQLMTKV